MAFFTTVISICITGIQIALENCENPHYHHHKELSKHRRQKRNIIKMEKENEERKRQEEENLHRQTEEGYKQVIDSVDA